MLPSTLMHHLPGAFELVLLKVVVAHGVLHELSSHSLLALLSRLVLIHQEHVLPVPDAACECFEAVVMRKGLTVGSDAAKLLEHAVQWALVGSVLLPVLDIRLKHSAMDDDPVPLHRRH